MPTPNAKKSERPTSLKLGHLRFEILWREDSDWPDKDKCGLTLPMQGAIMVRLNDDSPDGGGWYTEDNLREILVHEIIHAAYHVSSLTHYPRPKDGDIEEYVCSILAGPIAQVFQDNPKVVKYLSAA